MAYDEQDEYEIPWNLCNEWEISGHNENIHVHQALLFWWHGIKQKEKEKKLTWATEYMYEAELFHQSSSRILHNVFPDRQTV